MRPKTAAVVIVSLLLLAVVLRFVVWHTGLLPVSEEVVLKTAASVQLNYSVRGEMKSLDVTDPGELRELLAALHLRREDQPYWDRGSVKRNSVHFYFPDGRSQRGLHFLTPTTLGRYEVDPRFYQKACEIASRAEGRKIELLRNNP